jgi:low temperature requirement protein LtrA
VTAGNSLGFVRARRQAAGALRSFTTRYTVGNSLGAAIWLASLLLPPPVRYAAWALGLLADIGTPILATRWTSIQALQVYHPAHIKERYGLFTLIVLGESVVAVAAGTVGTGWQRASVLTGVCGFVVAACIWWIYFDHVEATALGLGRAASFYWGYGHLLVYAGIAAVGIGIEFAIEGAAGAGDHVVWTDGTRAILAGGAAVYLLAISFIRFVTRHDLRDSALVARLVMAAALLGLAALGSPLAPLAFAAVLACALLALTLFEGARS